MIRNSCFTLLGELLRGQEGSLGPQGPSLGTCALKDPYPHIN